MRYQYLLIDNDNTLMDFNRAEAIALSEALRHYGFPADENTCALYHRINDAQWKALERGETTQARLKVERFQLLLQALGRQDVPPKDMAEYYEQRLSLRADLLPGAKDFIHAVHGKMKIALVSNGVSSIQRGRLAHCELTSLFDEILISEEVGASKPDPRLLEVGLQRLGCPDRRLAVMMGDSATADIPAAVNAGVDSIYFDPRGRTCGKATVSVATHEEALKWLMEE